MELINKPLTEKQKKFSEIYCSSKGLLSNQECAIEAGYAKDSAYARATELLNPKICPCLLYTSPSPRDATLSRMPSSA